MKSVPSSSWRALLSLFKILGALVDPRPCRLQGKTDIFVWAIQMEEVRQHFACGESEELTCDHFIQHLHLGRQLGGRQFEV